MKSNRTELSATELDEAGLGVGTVAGGVRVHVADLLPGEHAEVAIDHRSPHKPEAWGRVTRRLGPSSQERVQPACPGFGRCGGCTWQHLAYPAQLDAKRRRVEVALADILAIDQRGISVAPVRPSPQVLGYRNKGKYVVGRSGLGEHLVFGAYAPRTHEVVDTLGCQVVAPIIDEVASWVRGAAERAGLVPYDEQARAGELRYVIVREVANSVLVALVVAPRTPRSKLEKLANAIANHPTLAGLVVIENDRRDGAIVPAGSSAQVLIGHGYLVEQLAGVTVRVGAGEFLQVNRVQASAMYERVAELASAADSARTIAVDLFSGVGGIALHLARAGFARVLAVEIDEEAVAQLRRAVELTELPLTAIAADTSNPGALVDRLRGASVVVVNPPRKGLTDAARELVAELAAPTVIYMSCGPETLGRDLVALAAHGYMPDVIEPFDLMPGTGQIETVVRLRRSA